MIGIIVDGPGDFSAIRARFPHHCKVLKAEGPRGHSVTIHQLIAGAKRQIRMLETLGCTRVILLFDYEGREEHYAEFMEKMKGHLADVGLGERVFACSPNRMIENWYLADIEELSRKRTVIRDSLRQKPYEGTHGKAELKKQMKPGTRYNEIAHGIEFFKTIRFTSAAKNSSSFADFLSRLSSELL